jgi:HlyD family secretion protein
MSVPQFCERRPARSGRLMLSLLWTLLLLGVGGVAGYFLARYLPEEPRSAPAVASPSSPRIAALGRLEPAAGIVHVYGPVGDRIARLYPLAPGQSLQQGQPIAELASAEERQKQVALAELELQELQERFQAAKQAGEAKIRAAEAEWQQAMAARHDDLAAQDARLEYLTQQLQMAEKSLERLDQLRASRVTVPAEEYDKVRLAVAQAKAERQAAEALRRKTVLSYQHADQVGQAKKAAAEQELREVLARFPLQSAKARWEHARDQWQRHSVIRAPISGQILHVQIRPGQTITQEPLLTLADLSRMIVRTEVYEGDVERLYQALDHGSVLATVQAPALPRSLRGSLSDKSAISRMIASNRVFSLDPRADRDRRVVEVLVPLDPGDTDLAARFVNLQVTVLFELPALTAGELPKANER